MSISIRKLAAGVGAAAFVATAIAATQLSFDPTLLISDDTGAPAAEDAANKAKILRLKDGTLVAVYADAVDSAYAAWDFRGSMYSARDVFVKWSKDDGATWSAAVNISNTAAQTDAGTFYDPDGNGPDGTGGLAPQNFYGDSSKPNIFAPGNGDNILVSWPDQHCPSGVQGVAEYTAPYLNLAPGDIQVPYNCIYVARLQNDAAGVNLLQVDRLTDASRDAIGDVPRGGSGGLAIAWQEDPDGLQPGEAEGPGDGGSGANVSQETDIWYSWLANSNFAAGAWSAPVRVSNNLGGNVGAARANLFIGKHPATPGAAHAILAYEETKGLGTIEGKYVIYHTFPYNVPDTGSAGVILSDPLENARRVRFVAKGPPGDVEGTRLMIFWKQGVEDQGGPSDIIGRVGRLPDPVAWDPASGATGNYGWRPEDLDPPVVGSGDPATALNNDPGLNLSSANLDDASTDNPFDDARAHRAIVVGDFIALGYSYTPDQAVARFTDLENYDFLLRRSFDGGRSWDEARNLSNLAKDRTVKEPRLVGTPGSGDACPTGDPADPTTTDATDCQDGAVFYIGWGTELNQYEAASTGSIDLALYISRSTDYGDTYEPTVLLAEGEVLLDAPEDAQNGESQLRMTPDGSELYVSWMQTTMAGKEVAFASGGVVTIAATSSDGGGGGGGGCSLGTDGRSDPLLPAAALFSLAWLAARRRKTMH